MSVLSQDQHYFQCIKTYKSTSPSLYSRKHTHSLSTHYPQPVSLQVLTLLPSKSNLHQIILCVQYFDNSMITKQYLLSVLFLLLIAHPVTSKIDTDDVSIIEVSTRLDQYENAQGSMLGGTIVYIKGTGFHSQADKNQIHIGPYPCLLIADGATENFLSCQTTAATDDSFIWGLGTTIAVDGKTEYTCTSSNCRFNYRGDFTGFIQQVIPKSTPAFEEISIWGYHRITDLGDGRSHGEGEIQNIEINEVSCSLIDVEQLDSISKHSRDPINCVPSPQEAGQYILSELVDPGYAELSLRTLETSYFTGKNYTQRMVPKIDTMSAHQGGTNGHRIKITGTGFSRHLQNYQCSVAGQTCIVEEANQREATIVIPAKDQSNTNYGKLSQSDNDLSEQQKPYIGGGGALYKRVFRDRYMSLDEWMTYLREGNGQILEEKIITQLVSPQKYGTDYVQYVRGYLHAPVAGEYRLAALVDDQLYMQISSQPNNANPQNLVDAIIIAQHNQHRFLPFVRSNQTQTSATLNLEPGYYYFEMIAINYGGPGYFKVQLETPQIVDYPINPTWQLDRVLITPSSYTAQKIQIRVTGASGDFDLYYYQPSTFILQKATFPVGCSETTFRSRIYSLPNIRDYQVSVTLQTLNAAGEQELDQNFVETYVYTVLLDRYRPPTDLPSINSTAVVGSGNVPSAVTITRIDYHSPPLAGTYRILIDGVPLIRNGDSQQFQYDMNPYYLEKAFKNHFNQEIRLSYVMGTYQTERIEFIIEYLGVPGGRGPITFDFALMTGGDAGASIVSEVEALREFSATRSLFSALPYDLLYVANQAPALRLSVNSIPAICEDCSYGFVEEAGSFPSVTSYSKSGNVLSLGLSDPSSIGFALSDIQVSLLGVKCSGLTGTIDNFQCSLPVVNARRRLLAVGDAILPAGSDKISVHINQIGYADTATVSAQVINLVVDSFTPATSSPGGLIEAVITGSGFPVSSQDTVSISLCGNDVTNFISVSNTEIIFEIPPEINSCNDFQSSINVNGQEQALTFSYDPNLTPTITSLSKLSSSPILKSTLTISGTSLGSLEETKVYLYQNGQRKYELTTISVAQTSIECILGGGRTGTYDVIVFVSSQGASISGAFSFEYKIFIDSISPLTGHKGGGYNLTITGQNLAPSMNSNNVFIGDATNMFCEILESSSDTIVCKMPRMNPLYSVDQPVDVVVTGRILEESECRGSCSFTYVQSETPEITIPEIISYKAGESVTIAGVNLLGASVTVGGVQSTIISNTDTEIVFTYPPLAAGEHEVRIKTDKGWNYPQFISETPLQFRSLLSGDGGQFGHSMVHSGNGFPAASKIDVWHLCSETKKLQIISVTPTAINFQIPPFNGNENDRNCRLNITVGKKYRNFAYNYNAAENLQVSVTDEGSSTYLITQITSDNKDFNKVEFVLLDSNGNPTSSRYLMDITVVNSSSIRVTAPNSYLPAGTFKILAHKQIRGYSHPTPDTVQINFPSPPTAGTPITSSFVGGKELTIMGAGFVDINKQNNDIRVCGLPAEVKQVSQTQITIVVPQLVTVQTQATYNLAENGVLKGTPISDVNGKGSEVFDVSFNSVYQSSNAQCFVGADFGAQAVAQISEIRFVPNPLWAISADMLEGGVFEGSNDNSVWSEIFTINTASVHSGWNTWLKPDGVELTYRYIRFRHTQLSGCRLAQIEISGIKLSTLPVILGTNKVCDVTINADNIVLSGAVTYSSTATSVVTSINPSFGSSLGEEEIEIIGENFGSDVSVIIDGNQCQIISQVATSIKCTTGRRSSPPEEGNSFIVLSDGNPSKINTEPFLYMDRWSEQSTWGGQAIPRQGDSVYVPKGMTLLVDVASTPLLDSIIVQGKIKFSDEKDMTLDARYFLVINGEFEAGKEDKPYEHNLLITMHGGYYDKQIPIFGNKVLGCLNCIFNMHGKVRTPTWTLVQNTISPGDASFTVMEPVDWKAGQEIVVAPTNFEPLEAEQRTIESVSVDGLTITVSEPFVYRHYSAVQTYGSEQFPMRAEVGLLTRNIKMQGSEGSVEDKYGSHLMMTGRQKSGLVGKISYSEFTKCGQPKIVGRYCTHFHMAGDVPKSYVRGISVHHSVARVLTIHGTHYLLAEKNVGYHVEGHNIFVEDGIETNNVIQDNLMITSLSSFHMLQTDITVAGYWVTNPYNTFRRNHAAGSEFYGIWYEIKEHPDGPSATSDICPMGMQLGESKDSVSHSNKRFGLRIFKLSARKYPCQTTQDETALDPYAGNPAIHSLFENYTLWRNEECGLLGEELGYTTIRNFRTADSRKGGFQFHKTNFTKELVIAENSLIVGFSDGNRPDDLDRVYNNARGVIASRTDGLKISNVDFYNFGPTMTPLQSCSECFTPKLWVTGGKTTYFEGITYTNIQGDYIFWEGWRREMFIDLDGSLTSPIRSSLNLAPSQTYSTVTAYRPSLMIPGSCYEVGASWNHSIYCDQTVVMRGLLFTNTNPAITFNAINIKVKLLSSADEDISDPSQADEFSAEPMIIIKKSKDIPKSWAMPFAVNHTYNIHWKEGLDFDHLSLAPSRLWNDSDGVVLRFNYTDERQVYDIFEYYQQALQGSPITASNSLLNPETCINGDYFHDIDNKYLYVCVSGRDKEIREWIDVNAIKCRLTCPEEEEETDRETQIRLWSNAANWPGGVLPAQGENVTIPYAWQMLIDIDPPILNYVHVNGILIFDESRQNSVFQAKYIWVSQGIIRAGNSSTPFPNNINIILHGEKEDDYLVVDPNASGNKMLAVTGGLQLYGEDPGVIWTRLVEKAPIGATSITVESVQGWTAGDKLTIAPSYAGRKQYEDITISSISGNTINFDTPLLYEHYGDAAPTIVNSINTLDARSAVGKTNRNIKISRENPESWGCRVLIYGYLEVVQGATPTPRNGYAKLHNVEFDGCGQRDTSYASLRVERLGYHNQQNLIETEIKGNSFHHCGAFCMFMTDNMNVRVENNFFYRARKFLVYVEQVPNTYTFTQNLMIGANKRDQLFLQNSGLVDDVACYEQYVPIQFREDHGVTVSNNLCQGSEGEGFIFPSTPCDELDTYPFVDNTAGSCEVAFMYDRLEGQQCIAAKGAIGYASEIGLQANQPGSQTKLIYEKMFFTDNHRSITLRYAHETDENACVLRDSYFAGYSRPTCTSCYTANTIRYCSSGYAIRMFVATITGETFPLKKHPLGHDVICTRQAYDFKAFIENVIFENYLYDNTQLPYCSGMSVFRRHNLASDGTASHHLTNSPCINCQKKSWAYFQKPNVAWRGWFGGCGELDCTGPNNYLIYDQDGAFTGKPSQLLSNNSEIGNNEEECEFVPAMNGHWCDTQDLAVLEHESTAPDFNKRKTWPVFLNYDGGSWTTVTNAWRQWQWDGVEPMNLRLNRFWSVLKLHKTYNLTFNSEPPSQSRFQIQKRLLPNGNPDDWAIIRIYYPIPNSIEILVKNSTGKNILVQPFPLKNGVPENLMNHVGTCGAHNFHYHNGTIQFVVNGKQNCQVQLRKSSYVQLSTRLNVNYFDFFNNNGPTTFLTNIATFLNIDPGRLKIVGIIEGSVEIQWQVTASIEDPDDEIPAQTQQEQLQELTEISEQLSGGISEIDLGGEVLSFTAEVKVVADDGSQYTSCTNDIGSTGTVLPNKQCQCRMYHQWNEQTQRCEPTCNTDLHIGVNNEDDLTCDCREKAFWDEKERKCVLDCQSIEHSVGQWESETVCECDDISTWNGKNFTCDIDCKQMHHSTGEFDSNNNVCFCEDGYAIEEGYCVRDCLGMEHALVREGDICSCDVSSVWSVQSQRCIVTNCDIIPYAAGQGEGFTCLCEENFIWRNELAICELVCEEMTDPLSAKINLNSHTCQCLQGAIWEQSALRCVINCSNYAYSTGRIVTAEECECVDNYLWDNGHCVLGCGFKQGETNEFDNIERHCLCQDNYEWSYQKNACYLKCYQIQYANPDVGPTPSSCVCYPGFIWNSQSLACEIACNKQFDLGKKDGINECECEINSVFSYRESKCMVNCYKDTLSTKDTDIVTGKCICKDNAQWSDAINKCECGQGFINQNSVCVATAASSAVGIAVGVLGGSVATAATIFAGMYLKARARKQKRETENQENVLGVQSNIQMDSMQTAQDLQSGGSGSTGLGVVTL